MTKLLLIKEIYLEGFRNLGHLIIKNYLKVFSWICFALILVAMYALVYRMSTGFMWD
ncbi:hypothetical protein OO009_02650 [Flavobacteriaceae bacterium KMM 6897]|nr:hypothetical protein [Flavobacteriaceae bacterium KMM 6897]MEB8346275.1 hypothetical protein [Flavobacteriaceae bacterium KMM 6898]